MQFCSGCYWNAGIAKLNHPVYSVDIAPSDYYLLSKLNKFVRGKSFSRNDETVATVEDYGYFHRVSPAHPATSSKFTQTFSVCGDFCADHLYKNNFESRLHFHRDIGQILFMPFHYFAMSKNFTFTESTA